MIDFDTMTSRDQDASNRRKSKMKNSVA